MAAPESGGRYDYVIVGGGTAGCVLANRLSQDPRTRVLLLEAGGRDTYPWIHIPVGYLYCMNNPRTDWMMRTDAEPGLNGRSLAYPRGRVLGGCTAINGMIYMRGQAADYDHWRQLGNAGWGWDDVLPWFRKSEDNFRGASDLHGAGGEWKVARQRLSWDILEAFRDAAEEIGIPRRDDFNDGDNEGSGFFEVNQRNGIRWTAAKAFLRPARHRAQSPRRHRRAGHRHRDRRRAGQRRPLPARRRGSAGGGLRRGPPRGGGDQLAETPRAVRHRRPRGARAAMASRSATPCPASAGTFRIISRSGRCFASRAPAPSTSSPTAGSARSGWRWNMRYAAAGRCRWRRASSASSRGATRPMATP